MPDASFTDLPAAAAWRHIEAREGFETAFCAARGSGWRLEGWSAAVEDGVAWTVGYAIDVDERWCTVAARITGRSAAGARAVEIAADGTGSGRWRVDGVRVPALDGCLDVDLEASACTNTLPVHRLALAPGAGAAAPAVYVRAADLAVERLDQHYRRAADDAATHRYDYESPAFGVAGELVYDAAGLVLDYPGLARRVV